MKFGPFVLGGNVFGWTVTTQRDADRLLDAFVDRGGTMIDTADGYAVWAAGGGSSETMIGNWLAGGKRDRVQIATKVAKWKEHPGLAASNIATALEGSLKRLRTDHVDLYYAHEDDERVPQAEYTAAFDALVDAGKVRNLGASNFTPARLASALALQKHRFSVSQDEWNLVERGIETALVPLLEQEQLVELPYFSLASGFLTGKYRPGQAVDSARAGKAAKYLAEHGALLGVLDEIAAAHRASVAAIALAWLRAQRVVGAPIASARTVDQLGPLFEEVQLAGDDLRRLSSASTPGPAAATQRNKKQ